MGKDFVADFTRAGVIMSGSAEGIGNMYKALGIKIKGGEEIMPIPFGIPVGDRPIVKGFSGMDFSFLFEGKEKKRILLADELFFAPMIELMLGFSIPAATFIPPQMMGMEVYKYIDVKNASDILYNGKPIIMSVFDPANLTNLAKSLKMKPFWHHFDKMMEEFFGFKMDIKELETDFKKTKEDVNFIPMNRVFDTYGISYIEMDIFDLLEASTLDSRIPSEKRELQKISNSYGVKDSLNPPVADYALFGSAISPKGIKIDDVSKSLEVGNSLGYFPSKSPLLPDVSVKKAIEDPLANLIEPLEQKNLVVCKGEIVKVTKEGNEHVRARIFVEPKRSSLTAVFKRVKKLKLLKGLFEVEYFEG